MSTLQTLTNGTQILSPAPAGAGGVALNANFTLLDALAGNYAAHAGNTNNPHVVTAAQLGLGYADAPTFAGLTLNGDVSMGAYNLQLLGLYFGAGGSIVDDGSGGMAFPGGAGVDSAGRLLCSAIRFADATVQTTAAAGGGSSNLAVTLSNGNSASGNSILDLAALSGYLGLLQVTSALDLQNNGVTGVNSVTLYDGMGSAPPIRGGANYLKLGLAGTMGAALYLNTGSGDGGSLKLEGGTVDDVGGLSFSSTPMTSPASVGGYSLSGPFNTYGSGSGTILGDPTLWLAVTLGGNPYKIPLYS